MDNSVRSKVLGTSQYTNKDLLTSQLVHPVSICRAQKEAEEETDMTCQESGDYKPRKCDSIGNLFEQRTGRSQRR